MKLRKIQLTRDTILIIAIILVSLVCAFAVYLKMFTQEELWYQMFCALLGVIISAVITMLLIRGQSDNDQEREKSAKIFEEKLRIYQEYLSHLHKVIEDGKLSSEEELELRFQTSYLAMHCKSENIAAVSASVKNILWLYCSNKNDKYQRDNNSPDILLAEIFKLVEALRKDLYGDGKDYQFDSKSINQTLMNFTNAYANTVDDDGEELDNDFEDKQIIEQVDIVKSDGLAVDVAIEKWKSQGWTFEGLTKDFDGLKLSKNQGKDYLPDRWQIIDVGFYQNQYYIQANYQYDADFSKCLKWEYGGKRSYGQWWDFLPQPFNSIAEGDFTNQFRTNADLQKWILERIDFCIKQMEIFNHNSKIWYEIEENCNTQGINMEFSIWYWDTLICDFNIQEEGNPFINIAQEGEKTIIRFGNRANNEELISNSLQKMACKNDIIYENNQPRVILAELNTTDIKEVGLEANRWINKYFSK